MMNVLEALVIDGMCLKIIKTIYDKLIVNILLNGEKLRAFYLPSGMGQGCPCPAIMFDIILEVLALIIRQKQRNKRDKNRKGRHHTICRFADHMINYLKDSIDTIGKLLYPTNTIKLEDNNNNKKRVALIYPSNVISEKDIRKNIPVKYLRVIHLNKEVKSLYIESFKAEK